MQLCITGRVVGSQEDRTLSETVTDNESAVLPAAMYAAQGRSAPEPGAALSAQIYP